MHINHVGPEEACTDLEVAIEGSKLQEAGPEEGVEPEVANFSQPEGKPRCI